MPRHRFSHLSQLTITLTFLLLACQPSSPQTASPSPPPFTQTTTPALDPTPLPPESEGAIIVPPTSASIFVQTFSFRQESVCSGKFVARDLDHVTTVPGGDTIQMFEANGGGVAINDLDGDGKLDIVLANQRDPNTILWNEGLDPARRLRFTTQRMDHGDSRAATIVDVDGDGLLDIVFSRRVSAPNYWRNLGERNFEKATLGGVSKPLYAIDWGDVDGDGDLDLVGGTYDAALLAEFGQEFLNGAKAGVFVYTKNNGTFGEGTLALNAQALALMLVDFNDDQQLDIVVGNDFGVPDYAWQRNDPLAVNPWQQLELPIMSYSTMSYAAADIRNNGAAAIFSTDMQPYADDAETMAAWEPLLDTILNVDETQNGGQIAANVLRETRFEDTATEFGIDATGWSWSGKFGDLDQDGFVDLYVVNGMIEATTFAHLPDHELREENQAFRNVGGNAFTPAPEWGLGSTASGRGMSMGDLDGDGDLDIVVNNLRGAAQLFENQLCGGGSLLVDLRWLGSQNPFGIGSVLRLRTVDGQTFQRRIHVSSGYLSADPTQLHFGFPAEAKLAVLEIIWPDGARSIVTELGENTRVVVTREE